MKKVSVLLIVIFMLVSFTSSAFAAERYGMVVFLKGSEFFNWAYKGMIDAAEMLDPEIEVELQGPSTWDATQEARAVEQLIAKGIDGIILTAGEANALVPAINRAVAAGIPVITFDSDAPKSNRLSFVGTNNYNAGFVAGEEMAEWLDGTGKVAISTFPGPAHLAERVEGFKAALPEGIEVVATVNDEGEVAIAETQITAMLQANPEIDAIFAAHGNPGPGAAAALRNVDKAGEIEIMGFDFGMPVIELIEKGEIRGTVGQDPYLMGYMAMIEAYSANHPTEIISQNPPFGHTAPTVDTGVSILYEDDIDKYKNPPKF